MYLISCNPKQPDSRRISINISYRASSNNFIFVRISQLPFIAPPPTGSLRSCWSYFTHINPISRWSSATLWHQCNLLKFQRALSYRCETWLGDNDNCFLTTVLILWQFPYIYHWAFASNFIVPLRIFIIAPLQIILYLFVYLSYHLSPHPQQARSARVGHTSLTLTLFLAGAQPPADISATF